MLAPRIELLHEESPQLELVPSDGHPARAGSRLKRALDLCVAVGGLLVAAPAVGLMALVVALSDRQWPFYGDTRIGLRGRAFRCWKLRTMHSDPAILTAYFADLRKAGHHDVTRVKGEDVSAHLAALGRRGLSKRSQARHLAAIRQFHRFLVAERLGERDPTEDLDTPRSPRNLPIFLTLEEVEA